jgi:hypothetical protein
MFARNLESIGQLHDVGGERVEGRGLEEGSLMQARQCYDANTRALLT